jgi:MoxR-like ATPase
MQTTLDNMIAAASQIILGKEQQIKLSVCCLLSGGHLLIEDIPGVGKTTLAHTLAKLMGLEYQRIQFTSDLLPADIIGATIYNTEQHEFSFHKGALFKQMILADEINRATPKAQSALLEAMEERQITVEGKTYPLPQPFFVIATQNPMHQLGTFPLPESQLDRFLMRIELGYPNQAAERELLSGKNRHALIQQLNTTLSLEDLLQMQQAVADVFVSPALLDYVQALIKFSRESENYHTGLSPRAGLALLTAAAQRYWRGPVFSYTYYKRFLDKVTFTADKYQYKLLMEPQAKNWVYALDLPAQYPAYLQTNSVHQLITHKPFNKRAEYSLTSYAQYNTGYLTKTEYQDNLQLLPKPSKRINALIKQLGGFKQPPEKFINNLFQHFRQQ